MYLCDTNVISELRKAKTDRADPNVIAWAERITPERLYLSAISLLELEMGVLRIERRDVAQGRVLRHWLEQRVMPAFSGRILPVDVAVARRCAPLHVPDPRSDRDALIAATALEHGLTVVTRNIADFQPTGFRCSIPGKMVRAQTQRESAVKATVNQRCCGGTLRWAAISSRISSRTTIPRCEAKSARVTIWISMKCPRPVLATWL